MRLNIYCLCAAAIVVAGGCYELRENIQDEAIGQRNRFRAWAAWRRARPYYRDVDYRRDFEDGFRAGYGDVAGGGDGTPPSLPPSKYWGMRYQSPEGQARAVAWFDGFEHGALAATQDGAASWGPIVTRTTVRGQHPPEGWLDQQVGAPADPADSESLNPAPHFDPLPPVLNEL